MLKSISKTAYCGQTTKLNKSPNLLQTIDERWIIFDELQKKTGRSFLSDPQGEDIDN
jgi:hypothetical protein